MFLLQRLLLLLCLRLVLLVAGTATALAFCFCSYIRMMPSIFRVSYMQMGWSGYLIVALSVRPIDPALVNAIAIAIVMSRVHLDVVGWAIVKCPVG